MSLSYPISSSSKASLFNRGKRSSDDINTLSLDDLFSPDSETKLSATRKTEQELKMAEGYIEERIENLLNNAKKENNEVASALLEGDIKLIQKLVKGLAKTYGVIDQKDFEPLTKKILNCILTHVIEVAKIKEIRMTPSLLRRCASVFLSSLLFEVPEYPLILDKDRSYFRCHVETVDIEQIAREQSRTKSLVDQANTIIEEFYLDKGMKKIASLKQLTKNEYFPIISKLLTDNTSLFKFQDDIRTNYEQSIASVAYALGLRSK
jgi:formate dehydrogenase maturation protein FdhE